MKTCEICGSTVWEAVDKTWKRCFLCGHLDSAIKDRNCEICGSTLGRFAKESQKKCINCYTQSHKYNSEYCITPFCGRKIKNNSSVRICHECKEEILHWEKPEGPKWKEDAANIFKQKTTVKKAFRSLKPQWPQLGKAKLTDWITRQINNGFLIRLDRGIYILKGEEMTEKTSTFIPPEEIYSQSFESAIRAFDQVKNLQAASEATAETILEKYGFPTVFGILAFKMASNWWRLKVTEKVSIEKILTNVLAALIAHDLAEANGLDVGPSEPTKDRQEGLQTVSEGKDKDGEVKTIKLARPKPAC